MEFNNKVILITGSSRGIGKATALAFAKQGAIIIINYSKSKTEATNTLNEIKKLSPQSITLQCDVSNEKAVEKMINKIITKYGTIDILINNVGKYTDGDEWNGPSKAWKNTFEQNVISTLNVSKQVTKIFIAQKKGTIINISSKHSLSGRPDAIAYSSSKAAMISITESYAKILSPFGHAIALSPGAVNAGYWLTAPKAELAAQIKSAPLKRLIEPQEIAQEILLLASSKSKHLNGKNVLFDGKRIVM